MSGGKKDVDAMFLAALMAHPDFLWWFGEPPTPTAGKEE